MKWSDKEIIGVCRVVAKKIVIEPATIFQEWSGIKFSTPIFCNTLNAGLPNFAFTRWWTQYCTWKENTLSNSIDKWSKVAPILSWILNILFLFDECPVNEWYAWCFYLQYIQDQLNPFRDDVDEKYIGPDGMLTKYDNYRYVSPAVAATGLIRLSDGMIFICNIFFCTGTVCCMMK